MTKPSKKTPDKNRLEQNTQDCSNCSNSVASDSVGKTKSKKNKTK